jgi:phosphosulfolactate synthase
MTLPSQAREFHFFIRKQAVGQIINRMEMVMNQRAFSSIFIADRSDKPRTSGLTMIIDYGMGLVRQEDILKTIGPYIDLAKIRVGSAALYEESCLRSKISLYQHYEVAVFPGGQFLEYAISQGKMHEYFEEVKKYGFNLVEVSNNRLEISPQEKGKIIQTAINRYGLKVLAETGSKVEVTSVRELIEDIQRTLDGGAWKVLVEALEFFHEGVFQEEIVNQIRKVIDPQVLIFEVPTRHTKDVDIHKRYSTQAWLVRNMGISVNIGNMDVEEVLQLEGLRRNLDSNMDLNKAQMGGL